MKNRKQIAALLLLCVVVAFFATPTQAAIHGGGCTFEVHPYKEKRFKNE